MRALATREVSSPQKAQNFAPSKIIEKQADAKRAYFEEKVRSGKLIQASSAQIIQFSKVA